MTAVDLFNTPNYKRRATDLKDFTVVVLVGYGKNLYPFTEGVNIVSKALLPVGGVPIINTVLNWILESGLTDILLICPPQAYTQLSSHLTENYSSSTHPKAHINLKRDTDGEKERSSSAVDGDDDDDRDDGSGGLMDGVEGSARVLKSFRAFIKTDFVLLPCDISPPKSLPLSKILDKHRSSPQSVLTSVFYEPTEGVKDDDEKIFVGMDKETEELLLVKPLEGLDEDLSLRMSLIASHPSLSLTTGLLDAHIYVFRRTVLDLLASRRSRDLDSVREQVVPWLIKGGWQKTLGERWDKILNPPRRDPLASALTRSTANLDPISSNPSQSPNSADSNTTPLPMTVPATPSKMGDSFGNLSLSDQDLRISGADSKRGSGSKRKWKQTWKCQVMVVRPKQSGDGFGASAKDKDGKERAQGKDKKSGTGSAGSGGESQEYLIRANTIAGYWELNRRLLRQIPPGPSLASSLSFSSSTNPNANAIPGGPRTPSTATSSTSSPSTATNLNPSIANSNSPSNIRSDVSNNNTTVQESEISPSAQISYDSLVGQSTRVGERASIKKSVIGRHCVIGRGAKITGCVLWDFVVVEENARLENVICCSNVRVGEKAQIKDCEFGTGFEARSGAIIKSERLVAGQEA